MCTRITTKIAECRYSSDHELGAAATVAIALPCAVLMGASDIHSTIAQAGLLGCYLALGLPVGWFGSMRLTATDRGDRMAATNAAKLRSGSPRGRIGCPCGSDPQISSCRGLDTGACGDTPS